MKKKRSNTNNENNNNNSQFVNRRDKEMEAGLKEAIVVPLNIMTVCQECWPHLAVLAEHGNIQTMSDLQVIIV